MERTGAADARRAYRVGGTAFVVFRGPRKDAVDEAGERLPDVVMVAVPGPEDKQARLASGAPWFATAHVDAYDAVLVRAAHLGRLTRAELAEVVEDALLAKAPKRLATTWLEREGAR